MLQTTTLDQLEDRLQYQYNISVDDYYDLLDRQDWKCAICGGLPKGGNYRKFQVDHDHEIDEVRGLLCGLCNRGLGQFQDSIEILRKAILYLDRV